VVSAGSSMTCAGGPCYGCVAQSTCSAKSLWIARRCLINSQPGGRRPSGNDDPAARRDQDHRLAQRLSTLSLLDDPVRRRGDPISPSLLLTLRKCRMCSEEAFRPYRFRGIVRRSAYLRGDRLSHRGTDVALAQALARLGDK